MRPYFYDVCKNKSKSMSQPFPHLQNLTMDLLFENNRFTICKHVTNFKTAPFHVDVIKVCPLK